MQVNNYNSHMDRYINKKNAKAAEQWKKAEAQEKNETTKESEKTSGGIAVSGSNSTSSTKELSETAKRYLEQLKSKHSDMDFIIADYKTDEEASDLLSKGTGEINVLIDPETLEKMATDEAVRAKYEGFIDDAETSLNGVQEELGELADSVKSYGMSIDKDGKVSYMAMLEDGLAAADKIAEGTTSLIKASSITELVEKIRAKAAEKAEEAEKNEAAEEAKKTENTTFVRRDGHLRREYTNYGDPDDLASTLKNIAQSNGSIFDYIKNSEEKKENDNALDLFV